jgi:hypothetical protein
VAKRNFKQEAPLMSSTKIDKFRTAVANGYSEGQASVLAGWSTLDFMAFMNEVIRSDGERKIWVFEDGSQQRERPLAVKLT